MLITMWKNTTSGATIYHCHSSQCNVLNHTCTTPSSCFHHQFWMALLDHEIWHSYVKTPSFCLTNNAISVNHDPPSTNDHASCHMHRILKPLILILSSKKCNSVFCNDLFPPWSIPSLIYSLLDLFPPCPVPTAHCQQSPCKPLPYQ